MEQRVQGHQLVTHGVYKYTNGLASLFSFCSLLFTCILFHACILCVAGTFATRPILGGFGGVLALSACCATPCAFSLMPWPPGISFENEFRECLFICACDLLWA